MCEKVSRVIVLVVCNGFVFNKIAFVKKKYMWQ